MHLQNLSEACLQFGNCMGIFYEPLVATTALNILFGKARELEGFLSADA